MLREMLNFLGNHKSLPCMCLYKNVCVCACVCLYLCRYVCCDGQKGCRKREDCILPIQTFIYLIFQIFYRIHSAVGLFNCPSKTFNVFLGHLHHFIFILIIITITFIELLIIHQMVYMSHFL